MILLAVITGYILGIAPFVLPKVLNRVEENRIEQKQVEEDKTQKEIIDEWLNGPKTEGVNQQDIYNEYITGEETRKGV